MRCKNDDAARRRCKWLFVILCPLIAACGSASIETGAEASREASSSGSGTANSAGGLGESTGGESLPPGIHVLDGLEFERPFADLAPLDAHIADATYVGLGESYHNSDGFLRAKARLTRYLVEHHGFRAVTIESPWQDTFGINEYVQTCEGDPETAVASGVFEYWADQNLVRLVTWLCEWNQEHPDDRVAFFGWDAQQPWHDGARVRAFLEQVAPEQVQTLYAGIDVCNGVGFADASAYYQSPEAATFYTGSPLDAEVHAACIAGLEQLESWLDAHASELDGEAFALVRLAALGIRAWEDQVFYWYSDVERRYEARGRANAILIQKIRDLMAPGARTVIWAHNAHLLSKSTQTQIYSFGDARPKMTGTWLDEAMPEEYVAFGIVGYDVRINREGIAPLPPPVPGSVEHRLHAGLGLPYLYIDLRAEGPSSFPEGTELEMGLQERGLLVPAEQYDGLIYLDESSEMIPIDG